MSWRDFAACRDTDPAVMFDPDFRAALDVCAGCSRWVRQACYRDAREHEPWGRDCYGVAGGIPAHQREVLPTSFRVPLIPGRYLQCTNPDLQAKKVKALNNPQPTRVDADGFHVRRKANGPPKVPCPSWGAIARHRAAGEPVCDACLEFRRNNRESEVA